MTPEERIDQIAASRGVDPVSPRRAVPATNGHKATTVPGSGVSLPLSWLKIPDSYREADQPQRERRAILARLELKLAAGVICRCLPGEWYRKDDNENRSIECRHRDGYGFSVRRDWRNDDRFDVTPLDRYRRDEPPSITVSSKRALGAIAADIERRVINNGLREAYQLDQGTRRSSRIEFNSRLQAVERAAKAFGGRIKPIRRWSSQSYPEGEFHGGDISTGYDDRINVSLSFTQSDIEMIEDIGRVCRK